MADYDIIVVGLGAMGSAALWQAAKAGGRVLGIDRFAPPHDKGSSHGDTRVTRLAIGEGDHLTPLVLRSHQLWQQIEAATGEQILTECGELIISSPARTAATHGIEDFFAATRRAAEQFDIDHEVLDAAAIRARFPQFAVRDNESGYYEPGGGFVRPERAIAAQLQLARRHGADIHTGEVFAGWRSEIGGVRVTTDKGAYSAGRVILACGAWMPAMLGAAFRPRLRVLRQVLMWFETRHHFERFRPERCPVFIWELQARKQVIYGVPAVDGPHGGVKIATEQYDVETTADAIDRTVTADEIRTTYEQYVAPHLPDIGPASVRTATCLYTMTPGSGFVIDTHPDSERVMLVSACSGHGFKHSPAIGEALSQWAMEGASRTELAPFRMARFRS